MGCEETLQQGSATFYTTPQSGHCSFKDLQGPTGFGTNFVAAVGTGFYQGSAVCGESFEIYSPTTQKKIVVVVTDSCPDSGWCERDYHFDLYTDAYDALGYDRSVGILEGLQWKKVANPYTQGGIKLKMKDGSNSGWTAFLISNHKVGIKSVSVKLADGNDFQPLQRQDYNYWVCPFDTSKGTYIVRVTSILNEDIDIPIQRTESEKIIQSNLQYSDGGCLSFTAEGRCVRQCQNTNSDSTAPLSTSSTSSSTTSLSTGSSVTSTSSTGNTNNPPQSPTPSSSNTPPPSTPRPSMKPKPWPFNITDSSDSDFDFLSNSIHLTFSNVFLLLIILVVLF
ncbi:beta-lactamase-type transpeptidase fold containing protein [Tieghemostelium lacteum]|uniref:Beta-lactamase-type transpeptidase fold containing protein n=1 Tax=Tieghemostelium lacteum TaxID=361077 RepID=A0A151Z5G4_TIELA|nr:beta-lactamase-type transpeptidase fold containing protein [Tieghemostelium lacteum]|eukprot:KYQ89178.1 beta-lactamase-type transpeptidase fold containing protein [Tieghemostelium lacteum]